MVASHGELPAEVRRDVAKAMSRVVQLEEENVRQIEDSLRARIDYLMGGEDKLAEILDEAPPALQDEMLAAVRGEEPDAAARLGRRIVRLDDLAYLDADGLKTLSRRVPIRSLASVLRSSEDLKGRVLPKLTAGLGAWLAQEIELATALSGERLAVEQKRVLAVLAQLVREGAVRVERPAEAPALAHEAPEPPAALAPAAEG
jgi:flagellar motor switch protein FliG